MRTPHIIVLSACQHSKSKTMLWCGGNNVLSKDWCLYQAHTEMHSTSRCATVAADQAAPSKSIWMLSY